MVGALLRSFRDAAAHFSPRRLRWQRFLKSLDLDPDQLPMPLTSPGPRDFIICGCSRTGTSVLSAALFQPPRVVTVMEPWDGMRMPPVELFSSLRLEISQTGELRRGRLDLGELAGSGRVRWTSDGSNGSKLSLDHDYRLGVKWPIFWRYLEYLPNTKFLVCVRHPFDVVASFKRVGGRLGKGLDYDTAFNRSMNTKLEAATDDLELRRALLYEHVHSRVLSHLEKPSVLVVRYERWFSNSDAMWDEISRFLEVDLDPPAAALEAPPETAHLTTRERDLIGEHCPSAVALGYQL